MKHRKKNLSDYNASSSCK